MKIVFMGTGDFAVPSLEALHLAGHSVSLVVSQPDRPQGRGLSPRQTPVKAVAEQLGIEVFQPEKLRLDPHRVIAQQADILVVVAYGQILREEVLGCAPRGAINVHASLLPQYRGAAPIQWAIANGETKTGVTTMQLDRGMDTGPLLLQRDCPIEPDDTTATLEPRLATMGAELLLKTLDGLVQGSTRPMPQNEAAATHAPLIKKSESDVDFTRPSAQVANRLRGFSPWPGARFAHEGRWIKLIAAHPLDQNLTADAQVGTIVGIGREGVDVVCGDGSTLRLVQVQPESRGVVSAFDFANGAKLRLGMVLGSPIRTDAAGPSKPNV